MNLRRNCFQNVCKSVITLLCANERKLRKKEKKIEFLLRISFIYYCISAYLIASTFSLLYLDLILLKKRVGFRRLPPYKDRQQGNWSFIHILGEYKT